MQHPSFKKYDCTIFLKREDLQVVRSYKLFDPTDDITRFEYMQKNNKKAGPALTGIELQSREDYDTLLNNLNKYHIGYNELRKDNTLFN